MTDNYLVQARQAQERFLGYDQEALVGKLGIGFDEGYFYPAMLGMSYRLSRGTGELERREGDNWVSASTHAEVMTLLDLICDSREDRFLTGRWKNMSSFGLLFHQNLLEGQRDPWAELFQERQADFRRACLALQGKALAMGDICYAIELFDGLAIAVQLWLGDEEFPPNLRFLWDENALMYLKYETMYFAKGLLLERIRGLMDE